MGMERGRQTASIGVGMGWVFKGGVFDEPGGPNGAQKEEGGGGVGGGGGSSSEGSLLRKRGVCFRREGSSSKGGKGIFVGTGWESSLEGGRCSLQEEGSKPRARFCGMATESLSRCNRQQFATNGEGGWWRCRSTEAKQAKSDRGASYTGDIVGGP